MIKINTLGKQTLFGFEESENMITIFTGKNLSSTLCLTSSFIMDLLDYFVDKGWFILGNSIDNVKEDGLGEYLAILGKSPKYASHLAAYLVHKDLLEYRKFAGKLEFRTK